MAEIGEGAFNNCSSLTSVKFPKSITEIHENTFTGCDSLREIRAPSCAIDVFETKNRPQATAGFAALYAQGYAFEPEIEKSYTDYIKRRRKALYPAAIQTPQLLRYMLDKKMIPQEDIVEILEIADAPDALEARLALLEYRHREFGDDGFKWKGL